MLWPLERPFQITCLLFLALIAMSTIFAPILKSKRGTMFGTTLIFAVVAFIPSCTGIMAIMDTQRFGVFHYNSAAEVSDTHVKCYLPSTAKDVTLKTSLGGHFAKYKISKAELQTYLDGLWDRIGEYSDIPRNELRSGVPVSPDSIDFRFAELKWPTLENPIAFDSPIGKNGGGVRYYFDPTTETVYHEAAYW